MKSKTFVEPRWLAAIILGIGCLGGSLFALLYFGIGIVMNYEELEFMVIILVFDMAIAIGGVALYILFVLPKSFSLLTVSSNKIVWRCPFYRSVKIKVEDCEYVGIEDMAAHNIAMPVIRGDEIAYIYLANVPFPEKYKHKADALRRKKGMITFAYSDALCEKLMGVLPEEKTRGLASFYNRMQAADKINKIKERQRPKKKKRKSKNK